MAHPRLSAGKVFSGKRILRTREISSRQVRQAKSFQGLGFLGTGQKRQAFGEGSGGSGHPEFDETRLGGGLQCALVLCLVRHSFSRFDKLKDPRRARGESGCPGEGGYLALGIDFDGKETAKEDRN